MATRRERQREATRDEIKSIARQQMAETGTAGLSLREIAREMGLTVTALYRYYDNRDALITALIVDAFTALAEALETARDQSAQHSPAEALQAVLWTYRAWAVQHPTDFILIYGNPIPHYAAPPEITVPLVVRGFAVIVGLVEAAMQAGEIRRAVRVPPPVGAHLQQLIDAGGYPVSLAAMQLGIVGWTRLHGIIMLELFNHLGPSVGDVDEFYRQQMHELLYADSP